MKKITSALIAIALSVSLVACGEDGEPAAQPTPVVTVTATPEPAPTVTETPEPEPTISEDDADEVFILVVREEYPQLSNVSDAELIDLATSACGALDRGASAREVMETIQDGSSSQARAQMFGYVVGAGVAAYCPEHIEKFEDLANRGA